MSNDNIGDYRMFHCDSGYYVARLCPHNTSNPSPDNAFWQQVTKCYRYQKYALKRLCWLSTGLKAKSAA